jgi:excisionase family DNA binding protein
MIEIPHKQFFTPQEVATIFSVTVRTVYNWYNEGKLPGHRTPGRGLRFHYEKIIIFVTNEETVKIYENI